MTNNILRRKDQTSIFCPKSSNHRSYLKNHAKISKILLSFSLIVSGIWIIIATI